MAPIILETEEPFISLVKFFNVLLAAVKVDPTLPIVNANSIECIKSFALHTQHINLQVHQFWNQAKFIKAAWIHVGLRSLFQRNSDLLYSMDVSKGSVDIAAKGLQETSFDYYSRLLQNIQTFTSSETLFSEQHILKALSWLEMCAEVTPPQEEKESTDSSPSSGTPNKKRKVVIKEGTSTSTTPASTINQSAPVLSSEDSSSSDDYLDLLAQSTSSQKKISTPGLNIFCRHQGKSFTFKSDKFPSSEMYINFSYCTNPSEVREKGPMDQWKAMDYRAKVCVGRNTINSQRKYKEINALCLRLRKLLQSEAKDFPGLEVKCQDIK